MSLGYVDLTALVEYIRVAMSTTTMRIKKVHGYYSRSIDFNSGTQTATNETSEHLSQVTSHDGQMTEIQKKEKSHRGFLSIFNEKKIRLVFSPHKKL